MEISSVEILKKLPEFEEFLSITDEIYEAVVQKLSLEKEIKTLEANVMRTAMSDPSYFVGGKVPSVSLIESTYIYPGINGEILPYREKLIEVIARLERLRSQLDLYKEFLNMWRTLSASERATLS